MSKSILEPEWEFPFKNPQCFLCGRETCLEKHHIFAGVANRRISEREGFGFTSVQIVTEAQREPSITANPVTILNGRPRWPTRRRTAGKTGCGS